MCKVLTLQGAAVGYGDTPVLQSIDLALCAGQLTALIGPNGSGKTTLLKAMARQLPLQAGTMLLNGRPVAELDRKAFARQVAYMPQSRDLPEITVEALVCHGRFPHLGLSRQMTAADRAAVRQAMQQAGVTAWASREVRSLSGGERQRVYLAMALAQGGRVLLLDEPTAFLDVAAQFELLELLRRLAADGYAVAVVLHDLAQALQYSSTVAVLANGALAACAPPKELYASGLLDEIFGVQVRRTPDGTYYVSGQKPH